MSLEAKQPDLGELAAAMKASFEKTTRELMACVNGLDAEFLFQVLATQILVRNSLGEKEPEIGSMPAQLEAAAFLLYPEFGKSKEQDPETVQKCLDLFDQRFRLETLTEGIDLAENSDIARYQARLRMHELGVRGEAYACHTRGLIEGIHVPFNGWFKQNVGISPGRALHILDLYERLLPVNAASSFSSLQDMEVISNEFLRIQAESGTGAAEEYMSQNHIVELGVVFNEVVNDFPTQFAVSFAQIVGIDSTLTRIEWDALKDLIGMTREKRECMTHRREVRRNPLYFLSGDRILSVELSTVYEALFLGFESAIKSDSRKRNEYDRHMSNWMEKEVATYLCRVFPQENVFINVTYPDPNNVGGETELDVAVIWGPFLLLVEIKGKQFRDSAKWGKSSHLFSDLKENVQEAFAQAQRAARYILQCDSPSFKEKSTGRLLKIQTSKLTTTFAISVTLRDFKGLMTDIARLSHIGLFQGSVYPWGVALNDLNIISNFLTSPNVFVHYVKRRIELQSANCEIFGDEIDLFSTYLENRLSPSEMWKKADSSGVTFMMIAPCSHHIDQWYAIEQGVGEGTKPEIKLKLPKALEITLESIARMESDEARYIAHCVMDIPMEESVRLDHLFRQSLTNLIPPNLAKISVSYEGGVVVVLLGSKRSLEEGRLQLEKRLHIEAYRTKSESAVGLLFDVVNTSVALNSAMLLQKKWEVDEEMERLIENEPVSMISGQKLPKAYDPCFCGSRKKFKFCCKPKLRK